LREEKRSACLLSAKILSTNIKNSYLKSQYCSARTNHYLSWLCETVLSYRTADTLEAIPPSHSGHENFAGMTSKGAADNQLRFLRNEAIAAGS